MKNDKPNGMSGNLPWEEPNPRTPMPYLENESPTLQRSAPPGTAQPTSDLPTPGLEERWPDWTEGSYQEPPTMPLPPLLPAPPAATKPKGVSRRAILVGAGAGALGVGAIGAGLGYVLSNRTASDSSGPANVFASDSQQVAHLLRRAGFGPWSNDIGDYIDAGVSGAIDRLLNYSTISNAALDNLISSLNLKFSQPADLIRWFTLRMLYSTHPLEEKMTMFWHGVLVSGLDKGGKRMPPFLAQQNQTLREHCLGRLDDLIHAISIDPAMLIYLDGASSSGNVPNENYSRELMELFTLGVTNPEGVPNYTQNDVHQGALALTGWRIQGNQGVFAPRRHFNGAITYLGNNGNLGLDDVVRIVCSHPSTPYHIAWRMWSFFAYPITPTDSVLQPLVDSYHKSNHSIRAMVETMLRATAFWSARAYRQRIKSPVEFLAGAIRGLGIQTTLQTNALRALYVELGQTPFDPPNVSGWDGDKVSQAWLSTQTWMTRVNLINTLVVAATGSAARTQQSISGSDPTATSPVQQVIKERTIASAKELVDYYIAAMLDGNLEDNRRATLYDAAAQSGEGPAFTLSSGATIPAAGVRQMLYLLMTMPEYQLN
jgi:uncharacterized protein (DUF1800 family)